MTDPTDLIARLPTIIRDCRALEAAHGNSGRTFVSDTVGSAAAALEALARENEALREASKWRPIETAPKDGETIMLYCPHGDGRPESKFRVTCGAWWKPSQSDFEHSAEYGLDDPTDTWISWDGGFLPDKPPTHWQPLSAPPDGGEGG